MATADHEQTEFAAQNDKQLSDWRESLHRLIENVEQWAKKMDWSTRIIDKTLQETDFGKYKVPALLMQRETVKAILEPLARVTLETEGVVEFYLLPIYDDIATFYYSNGRWFIYWRNPKITVKELIRGNQGTELDEENFSRILDGMIQNAAA